jgi:hypothetical protein
MTTQLALWRLNRISIKRKGILYEYVGYAKSESQPGVTYHVVVRIAVSPTGRLALSSFTCECRGFLYGMLCKHVRALYNKAVRDIRSRLQYDITIKGGDPF